MSLAARVDAKRRRMDDSNSERQDNLEWRSDAAIRAIETRQRLRSYLRSGPAIVSFDM